MITVLLFAYVVIILYSSIDGFCDAIMYSRKGSDSLPGNEHGLLFCRRTLAMALFFIGAFTDIEHVFFMMLVFALSFSFWHNGFYGIGMKKIGFKNYGFTYSNHGKGTNEIEFTYPVRLAMKITALIIFVLYLIFKNF